MFIANLHIYSEETLYEGSNYRGVITVKDISKYKLLRCSITYEDNLLFNVVTFESSLLISKKQIDVDMDSARGNIYYKSNTSLELNGARAYITKIVGIDF